MASFSSTQVDNNLRTEIALSTEEAIRSPLEEMREAIRNPLEEMRVASGSPLEEIRVAMGEIGQAIRSLHVAIERRGQGDKSSDEEEGRRRPRDRRRETNRHVQKNAVAGAGAGRTPLSNPVLRSPMSGSSAGEPATTAQPQHALSMQIKQVTIVTTHKTEKSNLPTTQSASKAATTLPPTRPHVSSSVLATLSDEELALLLQQELNSSPRAVEESSSVPPPVKPPTSMNWKSAFSGVKSKGPRDQEKLYGNNPKEEIPETEIFTRTKPESDQLMIVQNVLMNMADSNCANDEEQFGVYINDKSTDELRGKFYDHYREKQEANLREEYARKAEMSRKSAGSSEKRDPLVQALVRAQKLQSSRSILSKNKKELQEVNADRSLEESAAIKIQAAIRAYLAWRAFSALKGVVRLQAHVHGHLVRKQVAGTLSCVQAIVRLQALVRSRRVRFSEQGLAIQEKLELICQQNGSRGSKLGTKSLDVSVNNVEPKNSLNYQSTLTTNMISVSKICVIHSVHLGHVSTQHTVTGTTYAPEGVVLTWEYNPDKGTYEKIGESTKVVLRVLAEKVGLPGFDSMLSTLNIRKQQGIMFSKGAPERIVARCTNILCIDDGSTVPLTVDKQMPTGQQTLSLEDEANLTFIGWVGLLDPPREEARNAIATCMSAGIHVIVVTDGNKSTAESLCHRIGPFNSLDDFSGLSSTASEFEKLTPVQRALALQCMVLFSRIEPAHKRILVESLQHQNKMVAMTGNGVNDAPALKKADIGIAMGSRTTVANGCFQYSVD
eukprot:Gb_27024 [translate_table: standard]